MAYNEQSGAEREGRMRREQEEVRTFQFVSVTCAHMPVEKPQAAGVEMAVAEKDKPVSRARRKEEEKKQNKTKFASHWREYMDSASEGAKKVIVVFTQLIDLLRD